MAETKPRSENKARHDNDMSGAGSMNRPNDSNKADMGNRGRQGNTDQMPDQKVQENTTLQKCPKCGSMNLSRQESGDMVNLKCSACGFEKEIPKAKM